MPASAPTSTSPDTALTRPKNAPRPSGCSPRLVVSQKATPTMPATKRASTALLVTSPVTNSQLNTALNSTTKPNRPAIRPQFLRLIGSAPPVRLDRAVGREQAEDDDREEVDDVLQVEGSLAEGIQVAHRGEIADQLAHPALRLGRRPADDPGHQQHHEGDQRRHHLRFGQRGDEEADGHVRRAHQEQPEIPEQDRAPFHPVRVLGDELDQHRIGDGQPQGADQDGERGQILAPDDLGRGERGRVEQLDGLLPLLLRHQPHGEEGHDEDEDHAQVAEEVAEDGVLEVQAVRHLGRVEAHVHERGLLVGAEQPEEEVGADDDEEREHHVRDGSREVDVQLLLGDGDGVVHGDQAVVSLRKISSREGAGPTWPSAVAAPAWAFCSPGRVSSATTLPCEMIRTRWQVATTSGRMWVERMMVCLPASDLISSRTSMIWAGSRPIVGSSRISTSGSLSSAWASPTRCRCPLERLPITRRTNLSQLVLTATRSTSLSRCLRGTPLISATKRRYARTVMSV